MMKSLYFRKYSDQDHLAKVCTKIQTLLRNDEVISPGRWTEEEKPKPHLDFHTWFGLSYTSFGLLIRR